MKSASSFARKRLSVLSSMSLVPGDQPNPDLAGRRRVLRRKLIPAIIAATTALAGTLFLVDRGAAQGEAGSPPPAKTISVKTFDEQISANAAKMVKAGRTTFHFDTFGDELSGATCSEILRQVRGSAGCRQKPTVAPHDRTRNTQVCMMEMPIRYPIRCLDVIRARLWAPSSFPNQYFDDKT